MKVIWQKFKQHYLQLAWERKILWTGAALALFPILAALVLRTDPVEAPAHAETRAAAVDTYIPKGFVLVPIDVQNYEALDSILGQLAVVDLFQSSNAQNPQSHLVARNVRLMRAPRNPSHFAILVSESEVSRVLAFGSLFTVIVKRPDRVGTEFVKPPSKRPIVYEGE